MCALSLTVIDCGICSFGQFRRDGEAGYQLDSTTLIGRDRRRGDLVTISCPP